MRCEEVKMVVTKSCITRGRCDILVVGTSALSLERSVKWVRGWNGSCVSKTETMPTKTKENNGNEGTENG